MSYEHRIMCEQLRHKLSAVERERDEYKHRCKVSDGACAIAEQQRDHWMQRAKVADAEIAGRDAVAGDPVAWKWRLTSLYDGAQIGPWRVCLAPLTPGSGAGCKTEAIPLCTAAPPAVLPPAVIQHLRDAANTVSEWTHGDEHSCKVSRTALIAVIEALCALPKKPVVLPEIIRHELIDVLTWIERLPVPTESATAKAIRLRKAISYLDAANVKYEVKK